MVPHDFDKLNTREEEKEAKHKSRNLPSNILLRTKLCKFYPLGECKRGKRCAFAHDESALREQPDLKKTSLCQNMLEGFCENGNDCVYAHSNEELRIVEEAAELNSATEDEEDKPMRRRRRRRAGRGTEPERRISDGMNSSGDFDPVSPTNVLRTGVLSSRSSKTPFRTQLCLFNDGGICKRGEECEFPHRPASSRDTPDLNRTPICQDYMNGFCSLGGYCSYVHDPRALEVEAERKNSRTLLDFGTNNIATLKLPSVDQYFDPSFYDENHLSDSLNTSKLTKSQSTDVRTRSTFEDFYSRYYPSRTLGQMVKLDSFDGDEGL